VLEVMRMIVTEVFACAGFHFRVVQWYGEASK